jgi:cation transport protein ChaC
MWVFGYGSLMTDRWEEQNGCTRRVLADLAGYRRVFNKKSVRNWGTKNNAGPTLNLEKAEGKSCRGIAFEFSEDRRDKVLAVLAEREGQDFALPRLKIQLLDGTKVLAHVPMYTGRNLIRNKSLDEIAAMIVKARGTKGACASYIKDVAAVLRKAEPLEAKSAAIGKPASFGRALQNVIDGILQAYRC